MAQKILIYLTDKRIALLGDEPAKAIYRLIDGLDLDGDSSEPETLAIPPAGKPYTPGSVIFSSGGVLKPCRPCRIKGKSYNPKCKACRAENEPGGSA